MSEALQFSNHRIKKKFSQTTSFIETLLQTGILSQDQYQVAKREQLISQQPLDLVLTKLGFISDHLMKEIKAQITGYKLFEKQNTLIDRDLLTLFSRENAKNLKVLPLYCEQEEMHVAVCDPEDIRVFDHLKACFPKIEHFIPHIASSCELLNKIDEYYGQEHTFKELLHTYDISEGNFSQSRETLTVHFLHALMVDAVKKGASDIHFEPQEKFTSIRVRIDGVLQQMCAFHHQYWPMLCVRLKVLSALNIAETRLPQDGRFLLSVLGRDIDIRVSLLPTQHGENIVLRLLDKSVSLKPLEELGFSPSQTQLIQELIKSPEGLFIVTGPTGSGKTSTLYSLLDYLSTSSINIMTLEDPIEYEIPRIRQTEVQEKNGVGFAEGVRAILRQDPDVILIGEIRDGDTAKMAVRASMTGHLVFTTLHTQNVFGVIPRLSDLGISPALLEGNIRGILAQRLLRKLCPQCKQRTIIDHRIVFTAWGCPCCHHTGYHGRTSVAEILPICQKLEDLISHQASSADLRLFADQNNFQSLSMRAREKVYSGETSYDEMYRVVGKA